MSRDPAKFDKYLAQADKNIQIVKDQKTAMIIAAVLLFMFVIGVFADSSIFRDVAIMGTLILQGMRSR